MSLRSRQILSDPGLLAVLDTGEQAREYVAVQATTTMGAERDVPTGVAPPSPPREGAGREVGGFLAGNWVPRWARGDRLERALGGVARQGAPGSTGAQLADALERADGLLLTDRRLLAVVGGKREMVDDPERPGRKRFSTDYRIAWSVALGELVAARRAGRTNGRGRVELYFQDRSMAGVVAGVLTTGAANRLLTAIDLPSEPPPVS